jgi:hypothetical protein
LRKVYGNIEWTGNMIPFMDSLLQSQAIALPFRKVFVPIMISSIRCDPKKLFEAIEERKQIIDVANSDANVGPNHIEINNSVDEKGGEMKEEKLLEEVLEDKNVKYKSFIPFFADVSLKIIVTHGIEINGLLAVPIPRKAVTQELELESYKFIPNEENDAIEEIDKKDITEYIQV